MTSMSMRASIGLAVLAFVAASGCSGRGDVQGGQESDAEVPPLYAQHCQGCHGADGKLGPAPPLNNPLFLAVASDDILRDIIEKGRPTTLMPPFGKEHGGPLSGDDIDHLIASLRTQWGRPEHDPRVARMRGYLVDTDSGRSTLTGDVAAGQLTFELTCGVCHGPSGEGIPEEAGALNDAAFLSLATDGMLRRTIIAGRPDLGMPSFRQKKKRAGNFQALEPQDVENIVAFIDTWRPRAPTGAPQ